MLHHHHHLETWELADLVVTSASKESGAQIQSTATVTLREVDTSTEHMQAATGVGPVDATFKAIRQLVDRRVQLTLYNVTKIEGGSGPDNPGNDALASVVTHITTQATSGAAGEGEGEELPVDFPGHQGLQVRSGEGQELGVVKSAGRVITYTGNGTSTDIIVASARAYVTAINRMIEREEKAPARKASA